MLHCPVPLRRLRHRDHRRRLRRRPLRERIGRRRHAGRRRRSRDGDGHDWSAYSSTPPEDATTTEHPDATSDAAGDTSAEASPGSDGATDHDATSADAAEPIDSAPPEDSAAGCPIATPTLCGTTCVDEATDPSHCGGCSTVCSGAGANATNQCISSKCEIVCDSGYQQCTVSGTTTCVAPSTTQGVFVSTSSSATTGCGSISAPCGTIAAGIAIAKAQGLTIMYLDAGTYAEEVSLIDGLTIEGGWLYKGAGVWDVECGGRRTRARSRSFSR